VKIWYQEQTNSEGAPAITAEVRRLDEVLVYVVDAVMLESTNIA
tara:strand:+ start:844 stop:975 length:132 start_codon:yes stop_codon:yes gene_type:complete